MTQPVAPHPSPLSVGAYTPPAPVAPPVEQIDRAPWSPARRVAFRFGASWMALVFGLDVIAEIPVVGAPAGWIHDAWAPVLRWVGASVLHTAAPAVDLPNGAGDKTIFWVHQLCALVLAAVAALVWSLVDRRRRDYAAAHDRLRVYVRYSLGASMIGYGVAKLLPMQFPELALYRYIEPYGEFAPMSVLWSFMSASPAYGAFTGAVEALGAVLLFWRRTTALGALVLAGALVNVLALNLAYDVTVKGYSAQLLVAALFLLLPELGRLWDVLVRHAAVPARPLGATATGRRARLARRIVKPIVVATLVGYTSFESWSFWRQIAGPAARPALYGIWNVERVVRNGVERPPLLTDSTRWRRLTIERRGAAVAQEMTDSLRRFRVTDDARTRRLDLVNRDSTVRGGFAYVRDGADRLRLAGRLGGDSVEMTLRRVDHTRFTLVARSRTFHLVQDDNYQR